jgi:hypothetical protein
MTRPTLFIVDADADTRESLASVARYEIPAADVVTFREIPADVSRIGLVVMSPFDERSWRIRLGHMPDVQAFVHDPPTVSDLMRVVRDVMSSADAASGLAEG